MVLSGSVGEATLGSSLSLSGNGQLILSGTGSYTGGTFVEGGTLYMTSSTAIANDSNLTVGAGGTFVFDPSVTVTDCDQQGRRRPLRQCRSRGPWPC